MPRVERFELREASFADASAIAHVYVETWRSTYRGIIPAATLAGMSKTREAAHWRHALSRRSRHGRAFVIDGPAGGVVGFAACGRERGAVPPDIGEIYTIYLLPRFQRKGLGRRLMATCAEQLMADGFTATCVWVLRDNPARSFYQALGGTLGPSRTVTVGSISLVTVRYGWRDVRALEEAASGMTAIALPPFLPPISHGA